MWRRSHIRQFAGRPEDWKPGRKSPRRPGGLRATSVGSAPRASNQEGRSESERTNRRIGSPHEADSSGTSEMPRVSSLYSMASADADGWGEARVGSPGGR